MRKQRSFDARHRLTIFWKAIKLTASESMKDNIFKLAAALAYYAVFSLVPMLMIIFWISGLFYESDFARVEFFKLLQGFVGEATVKQIDSIMQNVSLDHASTWTKVLGIGTLVFSSTGMFGEIQNSINHIWGLRINPKKGFVQVVISRLISFSVVISLGILLVLSLVANAVLSIVINKIRFYFPDIPLEFYYALNQILIFLIIFVLLIAIFKVLPDARMSVRDVAGAAFFTAILFFIGKLVIGYILSKNTAVSAYGSASSVIIILLWFYYSSIIMYIGAEYTQASIKVRGKHIRPNKFAMWVEEKHIVVKWNTDVIKEDVPPPESKSV
jgi:membrane protein